jgi:hypothetical protein
MGEENSLVYVTRHHYLDRRFLSVTNMSRDRQGYDRFAYVIGVLRHTISMIRVSVHPPVCFHLLLTR